MTLYECERVSWGPYERGPVSMLWERHTDFSAPPACRDGAWNEYSALISLWFSDPDLARYVNETYGAPTRYATFTNVDERTNSTQHVEWEWNVEGMPSSRLVYDQALVDPNRGAYIERIVWTQGETLWLFDFRQERVLTLGQTVFVPGELQEPTFWAEHGNHEFIGMGGADLGAVLSGSILKFGDMACTRPE